MRRLFTSLSVIVASMIAFSGCTKEEIKNPVSETKTVQFVAESIETKTAFGTPDGTTYPTLWTENDKKISLAFNGTPSDVEVEVAPDFKTARFNSEVKDDASGSYQFLALSPSTAKNSISKTVISANIWTSQTPLDNSVDEAAQVLYSVSETYQAIPSTVSMTFKHFTAYGNLSFKNLNLGEAVVNSVAITSSTNIAGRWNYVVESGEYVVNSGASTITLTTTETDNIWFACAPVGSMEGETLTFTVNTNKGTLSKTVTLKSTHKFEAGKIAKMVVDMDDVAMAKPIVYELVKSVDELTPDSEVIIVAAESNVALSTTQNTNNRGEAGVTKSKDKSTIENPTDAVQVLVVGEGNTDGTISFSTGDKYLYAPGGGNYLRSTNELSDNASWTVTVADGIATITAKRDNKNLMRYNATSKLFSCYDSGQKDVSIYKLQGSGTVLENYLKVSEENIEVEADATSASFTVNSDLEWTPTSEDAEVTKDGNTVTVTFPANEDAEEKVYTVTVSADDVDPVIVTITQKGYVNLESLPKGIAAIKNAATSTTESDFDVTLTDAVVTYVSGSNAYIEDAEAGILVYKSGHGLQVGDKLNGEVSGKVKLYSNLREITAIDYTKASKTEGADVPVTVLTLEQLNADGAYDKYENMRIKIVDATVSAEMQISQDGQTYALYFKNNAVTGFDVDNIIDVIGYPSKYNSAIQLNVWENAVFKSAAKTTITGVSDVTVEVGATKVINAAASSGAKVSYVSANTDVATVDENGTVTGVAEGETIITVSVPAYNGYPAAEKTCKVTVKAAGGNEGEDIVEGESYTYTFTAKQFSANAGVALGNLTWSLAGNGGYWGYDGTKGQQFGSGNSPYKSMTLTTSGYEGGVKKIVINTSGASSINATFTVTVNGVQYGASTKLTTSATEYTFEVDDADMQAGDIVFSYTQTSSKAIYIKSIAIN